MSGDQIYQRRRVCETFADVRDSYSALKWSHFYIALNWDDAAECLSWAHENGATIAEMKAWRRLQLGEDVTQAAEESALIGGDGAAALDSYDSDRPSVVRAEGDLDLPASRAPMPAGSAKRGRETADAATLSAAEGEYAPFRTGAVKPPRESLDDVPGAGPPVSAELTVKRLAATLERCAKMITPDVQRQFAKLPEKVRVRFLAAMKEFRERTADLK
jgi:hypothetical protein